MSGLADEIERLRVRTQKLERIGGGAPRMGLQPWLPVRVEDANIAGVTGGTTGSAEALLARTRDGVTYGATVHIKSAFATPIENGAMGFAGKGRDGITAFFEYPGVKWAKVSSGAAGGSVALGYRVNPNGGAALITTGDEFQLYWSSTTGVDPETDDVVPYTSDPISGRRWTLNSGGGGVSADAIEFTMDGGGAKVDTGLQGYLEIPFAATITAARIVGTPSTTTVVDIWKDTYAGFPPAGADTITSITPPTISAALKAEDTTLTNWTTSISAGDWLAFNVDSNSAAELITVSLTITKT